MRREHRRRAGHADDVTKAWFVVSEDKTLAPFTNH
jgi:hypothetical protein